MHVPPSRSLQAGSLLHARGSEVCAVSLFSRAEQGQADSVSAFIPRLLSSVGAQEVPVIRGCVKMPSCLPW